MPLLRSLLEVRSLNGRGGILFFSVASAGSMGEEGKEVGDGAGAFAGGRRWGEGAGAGEIGGTGGASIGSQNITIPGDINCSDITCDSITTDVINGAVAKTRIPIISITADKTLADPDTGSVIHCSPDGANINISLPNGLQTGFVVTITNLLPGKTTTLPTTLKARGNVLSEPYSAATIYFDGSDWYGYGDLV